MFSWKLFSRRREETLHRKTLEVEGQGKRKHCNPRKSKQIWFYMFTTIKRKWRLMLSKVYKSWSNYFLLRKRSWGFTLTTLQWCHEHKVVQMMIMISFFLQRKSWRWADEWQPKGFRHFSQVLLSQNLYLHFFSAFLFFKIIFFPPYFFSTMFFFILLWSHGKCAIPPKSQFPVLKWTDDQPPYSWPLVTWRLIFLVVSNYIFQMVRRQCCLISCPSGHLEQGGSGQLVPNDNFPL